MDGARFDRLMRGFGRIRRRAPRPADRPLTASGPGGAGTVDRLARRCAATTTRRGTLAGLAAALVHRVAGQEADARPRATCRPLGRVCLPERGLACCPGATCRNGRCRCRRGRQRCGDRCISATRCCRNRCGGGATCQNGRCVCAGRRKLCQGRCIPRAACCRNRECGPGEECRQERCRCRRGFQPCRGGCIPAEGCCGGCAAGLDCRGGTCCIATEEGLIAALAAGSDVIRLCPNTTYRGSFLIARDVTVIGSGPGSTVLDGGGTTQVVEVVAQVAVALRGLSISNGNGNRGGGIVNRGRLNLANVALSANRSSTDGGAIYSSDAEATLTNCTLTNNSAAGFGGAIHTFGATATLITCTLTGNQAAFGGAVSANNDPGPIVTDVTLDNCRLTGNTAAQEGGAIFSLNADDFTLEPPTITLRNGTRVGPSDASEAPNRAMFGAGIVIAPESQTLILDASHVTGNIAGNTGVGGIEASSSSAAIDLRNGSTVRDNTPCDCDFTDAACEVTCT